MESGEVGCGGVNWEVGWSAELGVKWGGGWRGEFGWRGEAG